MAGLRLGAVNLLGSAGIGGDQYFPDDGFVAEFISYEADHRTNYWGFGGDTLVACGGRARLPGSGSMVFTGLGFQPQLVMCWSIGRTFSPGNDTGTSQFSFGAASGSAAGAQFAIGSQWNYLDPGHSGGIRDAAVLCDYNLAVAASLSSFDEDGFTLNTPGWTDVYFRWLALGDPSGAFEVGTFAMDTTTGGQNVTTSITPNSAIFVGTYGTTLGTSTNRSNICLGGSDGSRNRAAAISAVNGAYSPNNKTALQEKAIYLIDRNEADSDPLSVATATFSGNDIVLDWTEVDGVARIIGYVAFQGTGGGEAEHKAIMSANVRGLSGAFASSDGWSSYNGGISMGCWAPQSMQTAFGATASILDNFNRTDTGDPPTGWSHVAGSGGVMTDAIAVVTNRAESRSGSGTYKHSLYDGITFSENVDVYATMTVAPGNGYGQRIVWGGYELWLYDSIGTLDVEFIAPQIGSVGGVPSITDGSWGSGDKFGFRVRKLTSTSVRAWIMQYRSGAWSVHWTDELTGYSQLVQNTQKVGLGIANGAMDDIAASGTPSWPLTNHGPIGVSHEGNYYATTYGNDETNGCGFYPAESFGNRRWSIVTTMSGFVPQIIQYDMD